MVGKIGTHVFRDEYGSHVDNVPKLAEYGYPRHGCGSAFDLRLACFMEVCNLERC